MTPNSSDRSDDVSEAPAVRAGIRPASIDAPTSIPVTGQSAGLPDANDGALQGTAVSTARRTRRPVRDLSTIAERLSDRDRAVLRSIADHRFLSAAHVQVLHFGELSQVSGRRVTQRVLARLGRQHLLGTLTQRIGGIRAGSSGLIHYVDDIGRRVLDAEKGMKSRRRFHEPSDRFVAHLLAVADIHVALVRGHRKGQLELVACVVEPAAWRDYTGFGGTRLTLKPDLYIETAVPPGNDYLDSRFVEVDNGTESIPTLIKKCREYEAYRRSGLEQQRSDGAFPIVVWSMDASDPDRAERRRTALREAIAADGQLTPSMFRLVAPDQLIPLIQKGGRS